MRQHLTVADHVRRWTGRLRSAAVRSFVPTAVAALVVLPAIPATDEAVDNGEGTGDAASVASIADVHAPPPDTVTTEQDANPSTGNPTAAPHGLPAETTTIVAPGHRAAPDFSTTEVPASAPTGTGLTRGPPEPAASLA